MEGERNGGGGGQTRVDSHPLHPLLPESLVGVLRVPYPPTCFSVTEAALSRSSPKSLADQYTHAGLGVLDLSWGSHSAHHSLLCATLSSTGSWDDLTSGIPFTQLLGSALGPSAPLQMYLLPRLRTYGFIWTRPQGSGASHILPSHTELSPSCLNLPSCCWVPSSPLHILPCHISLIWSSEELCRLPCPSISTTLACLSPAPGGRFSPGDPFHLRVPTVALGKPSPLSLPTPRGVQAASQQLHQPLVPH